MHDSDASLVVVCLIDHKRGFSYFLTLNLLGLRCLKTSIANVLNKILIIL